MRWWIYVISAGISYLVFVLAYLPAQHTLSWLIPENFPLVTDGTKGTLWKGSAQRTFYRDLELGSVNWSFKPLSLFLGQIGYQFDLSDEDQTLSGSTAFNLLNGNYIFTDLQGSLAAARVPVLIGQTYLRLDGRLDIDISQLDLSKQQVSAVDGRLRWNDAGILKPISAKLGDLQFDLSGDDTMLKSSIKDIAGPLKVDGVAELLPDGNYRIKGKVKQTDTSEQGLVSLLNNIGRRLADGSTQIEYSGQL